MLDKRTKFLHLARLTVSADSRFVGKSLRTLDLRTRRGITIVLDPRAPAGRSTFPIRTISCCRPTGLRWWTDAELKRFAAEVEVEPAAPTSGVDEAADAGSFRVSPSSAPVGMTVSQFVVMCGGEGIVMPDRQRQDGTFVEPLGLVRFRPDEPGAGGGYPGTPAQTARQRYAAESKEGESGFTSRAVHASRRAAVAVAYRAEPLKGRGRKVSIRCQLIARGRTGRYCAKAYICTSQICMRMLDKLLQGVEVRSLGG